MPLGLFKILKRMLSIDHIGQPITELVGIFFFNLKVES